MIPMRTVSGCPENRRFCIGKQINTVNEISLRRHQTRIFDLISVENGIIIWLNV